MLSIVDFMLRGKTIGSESIDSKEYQNKLRKLIGTLPSTPPDYAAVGVAEVISTDLTNFALKIISELNECV